MSQSTHARYRHTHRVFTIATAALLMACGGGSGDDGELLSAGDDSYTVGAGVLTTIGTADGVLANDTGGDLRAELVSAPSQAAPGSFALAEDGSFQYRSDALEATSDSFVYDAVNAAGERGSATVTLTIVHAPLSQDDSYTVEPGKTLDIDAAGGVLANDTSSTDTQRAQLVTGPSQHNAFRLREDGGFSYTAKADASGSDSFTYRLHDGLQASADATVLITLDDGELSGQDDRFAVVSGDVLALSGPLGILRNDTGTDTAQVTLLERPTYAIDFSLADDGALVYRSVSDTATEDRFTYQLSNAQATLGPFEVTLTIAQPGSTAPAPGTRDYCVSFTAENSVSGTLTATGIANPAFELVSAPKLGSLVAFDPGSGQFSYERQSPAQGADTFSYRILDGEGARVADASAVLIQTPYRVMPVGDSITAGVEFYSAQQGDTPARPQRVGYRQYLKERLTAMGYIIDLVGDSSDGYGVSGFSDHQHNGYPGEDLSYVRDNMSNWLLNTPADVYLMHIGTNGTPNHVNNTMTIANTLDGWEASRNHPATVMMATLITRTDNPVDTAAINNYNALLRDFVVARQAQGDRMHLVDQFTAFGDGSLLSADELHPTTEGYSVMADTWIARLIETGTLRKCD